MTDSTSLEQSVGTEELYEDTLIEIIEKLENDIKECEEEIRKLQSLRSNFIIKLFDSACQ